MKARKMSVADELAELGEDRQGADLLARHDERGFLNRHCIRDGDDVLLHDIGNLDPREQGAHLIAVERSCRRGRCAQEIAVREEPDELSVIHDGQTAEMPLVHELCRLVNACVRRSGDRILGHTIGNKHKCPSLPMAT